jgi:hypothetical protein
VTSQAKEEIKFAGDYKLIDVKIGSARGLIFDLSNFITDINIYEDMFSPTISGNVTLNDAQDMMNLLPMIGEEKLLITFKSPSMTDSDGLFEQAFYIYKMTNREYTAERSVGYTLHFISFEAIRDINSKISKGYAGTISEIVEKFLLNDLKSPKPTQIEKTKNTIIYTSNYWSPFTNINYLAKRSISASGTDSPNYVFFENNNGYNFVSLDKLLEQQSSGQYIYDNNTRKPTGDGGGSGRNIIADLSRINDYKINTAFDYIKRIQSGMFASRLITHEIVTKTYNVQTLKYDDNYKTHNHLNPYPTSTLGLPAKTLAFLAVEPRALENYTNFKTDRMKSWYLKNLMQMAEMNQFTMEITVPGRSDLVVGQVIDVYIYRNTPIKAKDTEEDVLDKTFSGRYLITSLCHELNREKHNIHMTIMKDSLVIDLTKEGTK